MTEKKRNDLTGIDADSVTFHTVVFRYLVSTRLFRAAATMVADLLSYQTIVERLEAEPGNSPDEVKRLARDWNSGLYWLQQWFGLESERKFSPFALADLYSKSKPVEFIDWLTTELTENPPDWGYGRGKEFSWTDVMRDH